MATSASSPPTAHSDAAASGVSPSAAAPRRPLLRRGTHRNVPRGIWYALAIFGFALIVIVVQMIVHVSNTDPRNTQAIIERELRLNTLHPGERVVRTLPVYRRAAVDYFRQTRGLLVLTDQRLIYLGAPPRDITGSSDAPPTFDQRDFPIDTLTRIEPSFAMLGLTRALRIVTPYETLELGVPRNAWPRATMMRVAWSARHRKLEAIGAWAQRVRNARAQLRQIIAEYRRQPVYHVVRPGDALSSIASWYEVPAEEIQRLNGLSGNKIRVGERLLIRGAKAGAAPTAGAGTAGAAGAAGARGGVGAPSATGGR